MAVVNGALTILVGSLPIGRRAVVSEVVLGFLQLGMVVGPLIGGALIPLSMASTRRVWAGALTQMFLAATVLVPSYFLPICFQA